MMTLWNRLAGAVAILLLAAPGSGAWAQTDAPPTPAVPAFDDYDLRVDPDGLEARIDALVGPYLNLGAFNGVILIAQGETVLLIKAYGMASYELGAPNRPETRFRIASLSKQFTDAALARLIDQGALSLDDRLSRFLPDFPRADEITLGQLATHRSGVAHTNDLSELDGVTRMTLDQMVALLASRPLDFTPGERESYSNGGYDLLAKVIEVASGQSYEAYLKQAVLDPLGLGDTGTAQPFEVIPGMATGYAPGLRASSRANTRFYPANLRFGGGALYSDADDVFRLFREALGHRLVQPATSEALFGRPDRHYEITGRSPGYVAKVFRNNRNDITVVSLANNYATQQAWGRRLYQAAIGAPVATIPFDAAPRPVADADAVRFSGEYRRDGGGGPLRLSVSGAGELTMLDIDNDWEMALPAQSDGSFYHPFFDVLCAFSEGERPDRLSCRSVIPTAASAAFDFLRAPTP